MFGAGGATAAGAGVVCGKAAPARNTDAATVIFIVPAAKISHSLAVEEHNRRRRSFVRWTLPLFGERLRDSLRIRRCARERDVRHDCNPQPAFREREQGRHFFHPQMAIVTSRLNRLTGQRYGLEIPA